MIRLKNYTCARWTNTCKNDKSYWITHKTPKPLWTRYFRESYGSMPDDCVPPPLPPSPPPILPSITTVGGFFRNATMPPWIVPTGWYPISWNGVNCSDEPINDTKPSLHSVSKPNKHKKKNESLPLRRRRQRPQPNWNESKPEVYSVSPLPIYPIAVYGVHEATLAPGVWEAGPEVSYRAVYPVSSSPVGSVPFPSPKAVCVCMRVKKLKCYQYSV